MTKIILFLDHILNQSLTLRLCSSSILARKYPEDGEHPNFAKITAATPKTLFFLLTYPYGTLRERVLSSYAFGTLRERGSFISSLELKQKINLHIWDAP
ncbi:hypothetical protein [Richelia sinica]|uniref:hypothetical protein n=1 Tax=Richelia sinica TaxID=1357545 RepID=UPI001686E9D5|nr:hypothetical protein [Richelia sinica]MBD2664739.1 hypothetical protein [Richelia sinica FACHB-800]